LQVKLSSIKEPTTGWGGITHAKVGRVAEIHYIPLEGITSYMRKCIMQLYTFFTLHNIIYNAFSIEYILLFQFAYAMHLI